MQIYTQNEATFKSYLIVEHLLQVLVVQVVGQSRPEGKSQKLGKKLNPRVDSGRGNGEEHEIEETLDEVRKAPLDYGSHNHTIDVSQPDAHKSSQDQ